jgi:hypothetical protein
MLIESAQTKHPTKNSTLATIKIGFLPNMSENLAHMGVELAAPRRYAEPIQA